MTKKKDTILYYTNHTLHSSLKYVCDRFELLEQIALTMDTKYII